MIMSTAEKVFGGSGAVILEESERFYWFTEVYKVHQEALWYAFAWWTVEDVWSARSRSRFAKRVSVLPGSSYWVLKSGVQWGPLEGGGRSELWQWDGERATFVEEYQAFQL
jgi:hypothetical protein